jgi:hypothetical protein
MIEIEVNHFYYSPIFAIVKLILVIQIDEYHPKDFLTPIL